MQALDNPALSWQERAAVATDLLNLHARYWPWALGAMAVLTIHCSALPSDGASHRRPLYRFRQLYRQIGEGNLSIRAILHPHDYLTSEADLLEPDDGTAQTRISALQVARTTWR
jgi:hypothetical protein